MVQFIAPNVSVEELTRTNFIKRFLRETGLGDYGIATGGSTSTIVDTGRLKSTQYADKDWEGGWARISKDAGGAQAAPEGEISPITTYAPSTGTITVNPNFTQAPVSTDEYELWKFPTPQLVLDFLDQILKNDVWLPCWSPLSELPDFDMEDSGLDDWTDSGSTSSKVAGVTALSGRRHLNIAYTADGDFTRTASIAVAPGDPYYTSVLCRPNSDGTFTLQIFDVTNSAVIDSQTHTARYTGRIWLTWNAPATCELVQVRLVGSANSINADWDDLVFYAQNEPSIALPNWVKSKNQLRKVYRLSVGEVVDNVQPPVLRGRGFQDYIIADNAFGTGQLRITMKERTAVPDSLYILGLRNEIAYTDDTSDVKLVDENYLMALLATKVFEHLGQLPRTGVLDTAWITDRARFWKTKADIESRVQMSRLEDIDQGQAEMQGFIDSNLTYARV